MKNNVSTSTIVLIILVIGMISWRLFGNSSAQTAPSFSVITALIMVVSAYISSARTSLFTIMSVLFVSDLILSHTVYAEYNNGFLYDGWYYTYAAILLMALASKYILKNITVGTFLTTAVSTAIIHWFVTDFGTWMSGINVLTNQPFEKSWSGLMTALTLGLPFLKSVMVSNLIYGSALFTIMQLAQSKPSVQTQSI